MMTNATARKSKGGDADELERMIHAWTQAVQVRDADAAVADYADDVRNFDLAPPLQHGGRKNGFNRIHGKRTDGSETNVWIRLTLCFRKIGGAWKVTHEHTSVPFYMDGSFKAAVDLTP
jgi:PhnB protein